VLRGFKDDFKTAGANSWLASMLLMTVAALIVSYLRHISHLHRKLLLTVACKLAFLTFPRGLQNAMKSTRKSGTETSAIAGSPEPPIHSSLSR
jgi:hypothetical protein